MKEQGLQISEGRVFQENCHAKALKQVHNWGVPRRSRMLVGLK